MGEAAWKLPEPFELVMQFDGGDGEGPIGWSNEAIIGWLRDSLDLAGCDEMWDKVHAEMERRGLKLY